MKTEATADFCPRCGAPHHYLTILEPNATTGWPMSPDEAHIVKCGECSCTTRVTPSESDDEKEVEPWTPITDRVESALTDIRYNAQQLKKHHHGEIGATLHDLADQIERHYRVLSNDRRETVYEATNQILEHTSDKTQKEIEEQIDTILSTIGVPNRVINQ